ncbi:MAG: ribosome maturation factor RimP, partial [Pseudomonadota bacterium]
MDLHALLEKTVNGLGYELVDLEMGPRGLLRLFIDHLDRERSIDVDDCVTVSNQV